MPGCSSATRGHSCAMRSRAARLDLRLTRGEETANSPLLPAVILFCFRSNPLSPGPVRTQHPTQPRSAAANSAGRPVPTRLSRKSVDRPLRVAAPRQNWFATVQRGALQTGSTASPSQCQVSQTCRHHGWFGSGGSPAQAGQLSDSFSAGSLSSVADSPPSIAGWGDRGVASGTPNTPWRA